MTMKICDGPILKNFQEEGTNNNLLKLFLTFFALGEEVCQRIKPLQIITCKSYYWWARDGIFWTETARGPERITGFVEGRGRKKLKCLTTPPTAPTSPREDMEEEGEDLRVYTHLMAFSSTLSLADLEISGIIDKWLTCTQPQPNCRIHPQIE